MEGQVDIFTNFKQSFLITSLQTKENIKLQTDELINLLKTVQHQLCSNIDQLYHHQICLCEEFMHKQLFYEGNLSSSQEEIDRKSLKLMLTTSVSNFSGDLVVYQSKFEDVKLAIKNLMSEIKSSVIQGRVANEDVKFDHRNPRKDQIFNHSEQCCLASNCSSGSKASSSDSFEIMETTELYEEDIIAYQKNENPSRRSPLIPDSMKSSLKVSDWLHKNENSSEEHTIVTSSSNVVESASKLIKNSSCIPDGVKSSLSVSDWLHKQDDMAQECMMLTSSSNVKGPEKIEAKIVAPMQTKERSETLSPATVPIYEEHYANFSSDNERLQCTGLPFSQSLRNSTSSTCSNKDDSSEIALCSAIRDDLKKWLKNDFKDEKDKPINIQPYNVSKSPSNTVQPSQLRDDFMKWIQSMDSKELYKPINELNVIPNPAKVVEQSFSSYFVKDSHKEWLCSRICA